MRGRDLVQTILPEMESFDPSALRKCRSAPENFNHKWSILKSPEYVPETPLLGSAPNIKLLQWIIKRNYQFHVNNEN